MILAVVLFLLETIASVYVVVTRGNSAGLAAWRKVGIGGVE
jgi:hypothetical protein